MQLIPDDVLTLILFNIKAEQLNIPQQHGTAGKYTVNKMINIQFVLTPTTISVNLHKSMVDYRWAITAGYHSSNMPAIDNHKIEIYIAAKKLKSFIVLERGGLVCKSWYETTIKWIKNNFNPFLTKTLGAISKEEDDIPENKRITFGKRSKAINGNKKVNWQCQGMSIGCADENQIHLRPCFGKSIYGGYCKTHKAR